MESRQWGRQSSRLCITRVISSELVSHDLWWTGPCWLQKDISEWPKLSVIPPIISEETRDITFMSNLHFSEPIISLNHYSDFHHLKRITAWILRFVDNCQRSKCDTHQVNKSFILSVKELELAEKYWIKLVQRTHFAKEISLLKKNKTLPIESCLITLHRFIDSERLLHLSGRIGHSNCPYEQLHPIILHGNHQITKMIIRAEHLRLLHVGPTMLTSSICVRFHIIGGKKFIHDITRACVTCRQYSARPQPQLMGQLPIERVTPGLIFEKVGVDYAGSIYVKYRYVCKPPLSKHISGCLFR